MGTVKEVIPKAEGGRRHNRAVSRTLRKQLLGLASDTLKDGTAAPHQMTCFLANLSAGVSVPYSHILQAFLVGRVRGTGSFYQILETRSLLQL